jgi:hypothetical protein
MGRENSINNNKPPRSAQFEDKTIFVEHYIIMRGLTYYMRLFSDGSSEFVRYDETAKKWVFLCFPPEKNAI